MTKLSIGSLAGTAALSALMLLTVTPRPALAEHVHGGAETTAPATSQKMKAQLGSSAAFDRHGMLWLVGRDADDMGDYLVLQKSADDGKSWSDKLRISSESVVASGDERPRIAFGSHDEMYVTYSRPLAKPYTSEVRFIRSEDGGTHFSQPLTVHRDRQVITHGFASTIVDAAGRIYVTWIDKRDLQDAKTAGDAYSGAAQYYAVSTDGGKSFKGDYKIADHSCECCRSAVALNEQGRPILLWRHVFPPNIRDHALVELTPDGKLGAVERASFDNWAIDACPHQGPSLAFGANGLRHQTWFSGGANGGALYYAAQRSDGSMGTPIRLGGDQAGYADVAVSGSEVEVVWKEFDGVATQVKGISSQDGGASWMTRVLASTTGASDQPRLVTKGTQIYLIWRTGLNGAVAVKLAVPAIRSFEADGMVRIHAAEAGRPFVLLAWSLDCSYCHASMKNLAAAEAGLDFDIVTVAIESADDAGNASAISAATSQLGRRASNWAFGGQPAEQLRYQIDPQWHGELPRSYWFDAQGRCVTAQSGLITPAFIAEAGIRIGASLAGIQ